MSRPADPQARVKLLTAAEAAFVRHGLEGAKVEEIAARAGLSKGAFYLHFESKEEVFRALVEGMIARLDVFMESCPLRDLSSLAGGEFLDLWVSQDVEMFEFLWQNRGLCGLLLGGGQSAGYRYLVDMFEDRAALQSRQLLQVGMEAGLYRRDVQVDVAVHILCGAYDRLARVVVQSAERPDLRALLTEAQHILLYGIGEASLREGLPPPAASAVKLNLSAALARPPGNGGASSGVSSGPAVPTVFKRAKQPKAKKPEAKTPKAKTPKAKKPKAKTPKKIAAAAKPRPQRNVTSSARRK